MVDLQRSAQDLVDRPIRPPTPIVQIERRARILRRRRRTARLAVAAMGVSAVVISGTLVVGRADQDRRVAAGPDTTSPTVAAVPAGWQPVDYGDARIFVPSDWKVLASGVSGNVCRNLADMTVFLGATQVDLPCGPGPPDSSRGPSSAQLLPFTGPPPESSVLHINGLDVYKGAPSLRSVDYYIPELRLSLTLSGPASPLILNTLAFSARYRVLEPGPAPEVPADWQTVTYGGLAFEVPPGWPVVHVDTPNRIPPGCGGQQVFFRPEVDLGRVRGFAPSCPAQSEGPYPTDGVWAFSSDGPVTSGAGQPLVINGLEVIVDLASEGVTLDVTTTGPGEPTTVMIGLGPDPTLARTILYSLRAA